MWEMWFQLKVLNLVDLLVVVRNVPGVSLTGVTTEPTQDIVTIGLQGRDACTLIGVMSEANEKGWTP